MSWFCLKASWISCTVASLIDEKPWSALMAWALYDVAARRIRSRDEKTVKHSGEYLVAMEVMVKPLRVFQIRACFLKCEAWVMGPLHRSYRTLDGVKAHQAHVTDGKVADTAHAVDGKVADTIGDKAVGKRPVE